PTALRAGNSSSAVLEPSTTTGAAFFTSASLKNRPDSNLRARTRNQGAVVPTTLVLQLLDDVVTVALLDVVGATAATSGATTFDVSAAASFAVSVEAVPKPPRTPPELVVLPGWMMSRLLPSALIWSRTSA